MVVNGLRVLGSREWEKRVDIILQLSLANLLHGEGSWLVGNEDLFGIAADFGCELQSVFVVRMSAEETETSLAVLFLGVVLVDDGASTITLVLSNSLESALWLIVTLLTSARLVHVAADACASHDSACDEW